MCMSVYATRLIININIFAFMKVVALFTELLLTY